jgi:uncharacterized membrane protein YhfC
LPSSGTFGGAAPPVEEAKGQFSQLQGWKPLAGGWERLGAVLIHLGLSVLVLQAFLRGRRWWWVAPGPHTLVDFTTVGTLRLASGQRGRRPAILLTEGLVAVYALLALWIIVSLRPRAGQDAPAAAGPPAAESAAPAADGPAGAPGTSPG